MALYRSVCRILDDKEYTKELYRFEGSRTCSRLSIPRESGNSSGYIYVSNSLDHHMYFVMKRLKQLLKGVLYQEEGINLTSSAIRSNDIYPRIKGLVINSELIDPLYSYRLICSRSFDRLLKENSVRNTRPKEDLRKVERVDRRAYGGGYGLPEEWKELLRYLTFFTASTKITRNDLLVILCQMRKTGKMTYKDNISFIAKNISRYNYEINPYMLSDFNKYNIINALETILENGLVNEDSTLRLFPKTTIREVVDDFERGKEKTLELLKK